MSTPELASSYAALILADDGVEITVSRLQNPRRRRNGEPLVTSIPTAFPP